MSVRQLGGALRWVVIESLEERLEAMQERLREWGVTATVRGVDVTSRDPHQCRNVGAEGSVNRESTCRVVATKRAQTVSGTAEESNGSGELLLRRQLQMLDQLSALIPAQMDVARGAGDERRLAGLEGELREAAELRSSLTHCLKASVADEGRAVSEINTLSSECTSEVSSTTPVFHGMVSPSQASDNGVKGRARSHECRKTSVCYSGGRAEEDDVRRHEPSSLGETDPQFIRVFMEGWMGGFSKPTTVCGTTERRRPASSVPPIRKPAHLEDSFRVCGVAVMPTRPKTERPSSAEMPKKNYNLGKDMGSFTGKCEDSEAKGTKRANATKEGVDVIDASGAGISVVVRRMVRPTRQPRRSEVSAEPEGIHKIHVAYRPALAVRRDVRPSRSQDIIPGLREATEAAAVAVDAAMAAVTVSSTSAPHTPRAPQTPRSTVESGSLNQRGNSIHFASQSNTCSKELKKSSLKKCYSRSSRNSRTFNPDSEFIQSCREKGNRCMQNKQYEAAIKAYSEAIERDSENDILLCNRAAAYFLVNEYALALMDCESVLRRSPSNLKAHWRAAKALLYTNDIQNAKRHYRIARQMCINPVEERALADEVKGVRAYEMYYIYMKECRWVDSMWCANQLLRVFGSTGVNALPWHCRRLEAFLNLDSLSALEEIKQLREVYGDHTELLFLHAKCLFYSAHDPKSTQEVLELVRSASRQKESEGKFQDSRYTHLERTVVSFERHRDRGNTAYKNGDWGEAHAAYTRCLSLDPLNKSLVALTYCNRAAASMQGGQWNDALSDITHSLHINPNSAKAYARRARVYIHFMYEKEGIGIDYLELAISDLKKTVELAATDENRQQLAEAVKLRQEREEQRYRESHDAGNDNTRRNKTTNEPRRFNFTNSSKTTFSGPNRKAENQNGNQQNIFTSINSREHCIKVLGLESTTGLDARSLAKAYREAALRWHPDKWIGSDRRDHEIAERKFKEINMAYQSLKEMILR